ncbi:uncharacterized protein Dwil_GK20143 [Drosophila willistoni]|uniref:RING-CH-type domain-containing protein n=1 Tax=Drosophila willistoni TaxID=7260 RepID=B4MTE2_DROWI|nr:uncharacterized protein LOC6641491 [Drosophila willistoni]EDW75381.1 uncharacterized protein Dwil_GK20143 [Drosophila willistoni]
MPQHETQPYTLSEATAIRLFNSVVASRATPPPPPSTSLEAAAEAEPSSVQALADTDGGVDCSGTAVIRPLPFILPSLQESIHSANELGNSCRICRWNRSDMEIINCPCKCKGSVGFVHLKCLKRWIMHRRDNRCEICHATFDLIEDHASLKQMMRTFCCSRCCGLIVKHMLFSASLVPLANNILQQVLLCMDNLNQGCTEQLTVQEVFVASCALLTSSALFFHFFEFVTTRCLLIRNILRHWWMFGSTSDFALIEIDDDSVDLF